MELKEVVKDRPVSGEYLIIENQLKTAKNGNSYLAIKIADQTGQMAVKIWDADQELFRLLEVGKVIELLNVPPKTYKEQIQLDFDSKSNLFKIVPEAKVDYSKFLPQAPGNLQTYWDFLQETKEGIGDSFLQNLLRYFFDEPNFKVSFMRVPAALKRHHAYLGGLVEHTAGVTALCKAAADYYPMVNRDLLLTGAILHDIGKIKTYQLERGIEGTDEGKLIGHLILGVEMVEAAIIEVLKQTKDIAGTKLLRNSLIHLLVSHHGIMEWGSPVEPLTLEACMLHHADNMDAQITKFLTIIRGDNGGKEWSGFDSGLGRAVFLGGLAANLDETEHAEDL